MAAIDIRIQRIEQLFDSLEPSPFHENEKALRRDAENYIVDVAGEHGRAEPLRLIVHAPVSIKPHAAELTRAVHAHFELAHVQCRRRYQRRMRIGRTLLVAGTAVLAIALLLRALLGDPGDRALIVAIGEGIADSRVGRDVAPARDPAVRTLGEPPAERAAPSPRPDPRGLRVRPDRARACAGAGTRIKEGKADEAD